MLTNNELINWTLQVLGSALVIVLACFSVAGIWCALKEYVHTIKLRYRHKHRFDKPPTAKCYCMDCKKHGPDTGRCYKFDRWYTADNWFCWDAEPREKGVTNGKYAN